MRISTIILCLAFLFVHSFALANEDFSLWLDGVRQEAASEGISASTINEALGGIDAPNETVLKLDIAQPEKKLTFSQYKNSIVSPARVKRGREMYRKHRAFLREIERKTGTQGHYIVALWGIETNYGSNTGGFNVVPVLATLAYDGRRADFFRKELIAALKVLDQGHVSYQDMTGSWAGAMGQVQFMPRSFLELAVDGDGDGRKDIWNSQKDALASAANYLKVRGWKKGELWGRRVDLPKDFDKSILGRENKKSLEYWNKIGVRKHGGGRLPSADIKGAIVMPGDDYAFLVYSNYDVLMDWNRSLYFATSVGLLANEIIAP